MRNADLLVKRIKNGWWKISTIQHGTGKKRAWFRSTAMAGIRAANAYHHKLDNDLACEIWAESNRA